MTRFFVVPQWQGSPAARAMHLVDGAEAIAGDLPRASTARVEVPASAGEALDTGIRRFSALSRTAAALREALAAHEGPTGDGDGDGDENFLVIGGDCGVAVPAIAHAAARRGALDDSLAVVWFDAHGDLNTPDASPSGAFAGMALRAVIDDLPWRAAARSPRAVSSSPGRASSTMRKAPPSGTRRSPISTSRRWPIRSPWPTRLRRRGPVRSTCTSTSTCSILR